MNGKGIILRQSKLSVSETTDKIASVLTGFGITIYTRIDQQKEAAKQNIVLRPLQFLLFGNPLKGGEVMRENVIAALDLPLKVIVREDSQGKTWVYYNDAAYIGNRYSLSSITAELLNVDPLITKILNQ